MEVTEGVSKPIQTVGDQAQEMAGLGIMRSQLERVSVLLGSNDLEEGL